MIVVDASAVCEILLPTPGAAALEARVFRGDRVACAPHLLDIEVIHVLRRYTLNGVIEANRGRRALTDFAGLRIRRFPHEPLWDRIWSLRHNVSAYDATYVALAEALGATLVTGDRRLANAAGIRTRIEAI